MQMRITEEKTVKRTSGKRWISLVLALCLLLTLAGCGGKKPLLEQPIQSLTCVQPVSFPTMISRGGGQALIGWTDYEENVTHLSVIDIAKDRETASRQLEGCWDLQAETFTDGTAALFNWEDSTWQFIGSDLSPTTAAPTISCRTACCAAPT